MRHVKPLLGLTLVLAFAAGASAKGQLGDPAAPLAIKKWVKGGAVKLTKGRVYVVEFWATWCGPCRSSIPHLNELHNRFQGRDVNVIGVTQVDRRQDLADIEQFVKQQGRQMAYTIAVDDGGKTWRAYMDAFDKNGIPQAFVVDRKGKIVWEGYPTAGLTNVVEAVLAGNSDAADLQTIAKKGDVAHKRLTTAIKQYFEKARQTNDVSALTDLAQTIRQDGPSHPSLLNKVAWEILTADALPARDLPFALEVARLAVEETHSQEAYILDTYALALFENGQPQDAAAQQRKALALLKKTDPARKGAEDALVKYVKAAKRS